jgi:hypothetical protein
VLNADGVAAIPVVTSSMPPPLPSLPSGLGGARRPMPNQDLLPDGARTQRVYAAARAAAEFCGHPDPAAARGVRPDRACARCVTAAVVAVIDPPGTTTVPATWGRPS